MTLVSGNIRYMRIFAGVLRVGASNDDGLSSTATSKATSLKTFEIRLAVLYCDKLTFSAGN